MDLPPFTISQRQLEILRQWHRIQIQSKTFADSSESTSIQSGGIPQETSNHHPDHQTIPSQSLLLGVTDSYLASIHTIDSDIDIDIEEITRGIRDLQWRKPLRIQKRHTTIQSLEVMAELWPTFSGRPSDSAVEYIEGLEVALTLTTPPLPDPPPPPGSEQAKNRELIMKVRLRQGLRGIAKEWYQMESTAADKTSYNSLKEALKLRFPESTSGTGDIALLTEIATFTRKPDEGLQDFVNRAERLYLRIRTDPHRRMLATNVLTRMTEGDRDIHIQERVIDRLSNKNKIQTVTAGGEIVTDDCTFRDVANEIMACSSRFGVPVERNASRDDDNPDDGMMSMRDISKFLKYFEREPEKPKPTQPPPAMPTPTPYNPYGTIPGYMPFPMYGYPHVPPGQQPPGFVPPQQQPVPQPAAQPAQQPRGQYQNRSPFDITRAGCDNCGGIGHISPSCPEPPQPYAVRQKRRAERLLKEEQEREQKAQQTRTGANGMPLGPPRTATAATLQGAIRDDNEPEEQIACISGEAWYRESSPEVSKMLAELKQREFDALAKLGSDASSNEAMLCATAREPKGKSKIPHTAPRDRDNEKARKKTVIKIKPPVKKTVTFQGYQSPRVEELSDDDAEVDTQTSPEVIEPYDSDATVDLTGDAEDDDPDANDEQEPDIENFEWRNRLIEDIVAKQAERARKELQDRSKHGRKPKPAVSNPILHADAPLVSDADIIQMDKVMEELQQKVKAQARSTGQSHIVALDQCRLSAFDLADTLKNVSLEIPLWQLLDAAPRLRSEMHRLIAADTHAARGRKKKSNTFGNTSNALTRSAASMSTSTPGIIGPTPGIDGPMWQDVALSVDDVGEASVGYVQGWVNGRSQYKLMLDSGASIDCINPRLVHKLNLMKHFAVKPYKIRLADNRKDTLEEYVYADIVVGGVLCCMAAFVYGSDEMYDMLLSSSWLRRVGARQSWVNDTLELRGRKGIESKVPVRSEPGLKSLMLNPVLSEGDMGIDVIESFGTMRRLVTMVEFTELLDRVLSGGERHDDEAEDQQDPKDQSEL